MEEKWSEIFPFDLELNYYSFLVTRDLNTSIPEHRLAKQFKILPRNEKSTEGQHGKCTILTDTSEKQLLQKLIPNTKET